MRFLVDAQLPPALARWLEPFLPEILRRLDDGEKLIGVR